MQECVKLRDLPTIKTINLREVTIFNKDNYSWHHNSYFSLNWQNYKLLDQLAFANFLGFTLHPTDWNLSFAEDLISNESESGLTNTNEGSVHLLRLWPLSLRNERFLSFSKTARKGNEASPSPLLPILLLAPSALLRSPSCSLACSMIAHPKSYKSPGFSTSGKFNCAWLVKGVSLS